MSLILSSAQCWQAFHFFFLKEQKYRQFQSRTVHHKEVSCHKKLVLLIKCKDKWVSDKKLHGSRRLKTPQPISETIQHSSQLCNCQNQFWQMMRANKYKKTAKHLKTWLHGYFSGAMDRVIFQLFFQTEQKRVMRFKKQKCSVWFVVYLSAAHLGAETNCHQKVIQIFCNSPEKEDFFLFLEAFLVFATDSENTFDYFLCRAMKWLDSRCPGDSLVTQVMCS